MTCEQMQTLKDAVYALAEARDDLNGLPDVPELAEILKQLNRVDLAPLLRRL